MNQKKSCLISGSAGQMGSYLTALLENEYDLYCLSRQAQPYSKRHHSLCLDLRDKKLVDNLPLRMDSIVHLAQSENFRAFPEKVEEVFDVNTLSTLKLLDYARKSGCKNFIYASSGVVYNNTGRPFIEDDPIFLKSGKLGFYYATKLCSELIAENYQDYMNVIVLRFFFVYGPEQKSNMLMPRLLQSILDGKPIELEGEEGIRMNPIYVSDAVEAIRQALKLESSEKINIAGSQVVSLREIALEMAKVLGEKAYFNINKSAQGKDIIGDTLKMERLLGKGKLSFSEGIHNFISQQVSHCASL